MADRGWPWARYRPLVEAALQSGWPIVAINLSADEARRVAMAGYDAVPRVAEWRANTRVLEAEWPEAQTTRWLDIAYDAHCEMVPRDQLVGFLRAQRARDLGMALAIQSALETAQENGREVALEITQGAVSDLASGAARPVVVAILGREHARRDYAVPAALEALGMAPTRVWSLGMGEASPDDASGSGRDRTVATEGPTANAAVGWVATAPGNGSVDDEGDAIDGRFDAAYRGRSIDRPDPCAAFAAADRVFRASGSGSGRHSPRRPRTVHPVSISREGVGRAGRAYVAGKGFAWSSGVARA